MATIWSAQKKHSTWRRLWIALAECQQKLGLNITDAQLTEMRANIDNVDFDAANRYERELRHDVMAHVHAYGDVAPLARPIIHLGATSCYVGDNTDMLILRDALLLVQGKLVTVLRALSAFAKAHKALPTLAFTHFQPAQPTTVGKRTTLYLQDLLMDLDYVEHLEQQIKARIEIAGKGLFRPPTAGVDVHGDNSMLAFEGGVVRKPLPGSNEKEVFESIRQSLT